MYFSISIRLTLVSDSQAAKNGDIVGRVVLAPGNLSNVKLWLWNCLLQHKECLPPVADYSESYKPRLPTRVINVGSSNDDITLLVTEGLTGDYLTLSHRWGTADIPRTTTDNLATYQASIPWEALTQTVPRCCHRHSRPRLPVPVGGLTLDSPRRRRRLGA